MTDQIDLLQERVSFSLKEEVAIEYKSLDKLRIDGMKYTETKCRKLKMGAVPWTPELTKIRMRIEVWMLVLKRIKCKRNWR